MRVVGGKAKGRRLKGTVSPGARPTTERARAAIFNVLDPELYQDRRVLDLFAGSGSLGIEALSRGAEWADFVERSRKQCGVLRSNLENTGFSRQAGVYCADVEHCLAQLLGPYSLVMLDPPYRMQNLGEFLQKLAAMPTLVEEGGMVVVGHSKHLTLAHRYGPLQLASHRQYGDNVVEFFGKEAVDGDGPVPR